MVDIGYKSDGQIPIHEFTTPEGEVTAQVGDDVEALMESREDEEGALMLSKNKASKIKVWGRGQLRLSPRRRGAGHGGGQGQGGLSVDLGGIIAFCLAPRWTWPHAPYRPSHRGEILLPGLEIQP